MEIFGVLFILMLLGGANARTAPDDRVGGCGCLFLIFILACVWLHYT